MTSHFWGHLLMTLKLQGYKLTWTRESNKQILSGHQIIAYFYNSIDYHIENYFDMLKGITILRIFSNLKLPNF